MIACVLMEVGVLCKLAYIIREKNFRLTFDEMCFPLSWSPPEKCSFYCVFISYIPIQQKTPDATSLAKKLITFFSNGNMAGDNQVHGHEKTQDTFHLCIVHCSLPVHSQYRLLYWRNWQHRWKCLLPMKTGIQSLVNS